MSSTEHWTKRLQVGDVIRSKTGKLRIVRYASHDPRKPTPSGSFFAFCIGRVSWTTRPYTFVTGNDLKQSGYMPTGARAKLNHEFDRKLLACMDKATAAECSLHARQVVGIL